MSDSARLGAKEYSFSEPPLSRGELIALPEAASRLGVHYMTMYRYMRTGRISARWQDGQWWVVPAELDALIAELSARAQGARRLPRSLRVHAGLATIRKPDPAVVRRLRSRLLVGDEPGAWVVLEELLVAGHDGISILVDVLGPAMRSIGELWQAGRISIAEEHLASQVAERLVVGLGARFRKAGRRSQAVVLATAQGEQHHLPLTMAVQSLQILGFGVLDVGCDLPVSDLLDLVRRPPRPLVGVVLGATLSSHLPALAEAVSLLRQVAPRLPVLVGGAAVPTDSLAREIGAVGWSGLDARSLVCSVEGLVEGTARSSARQM